MSQYSALAPYYDRLNADVPYARFARRIDGLLKRNKLPAKLVLELGCGTGTLSQLLSQKGYEMIACDQAPDMLELARQKCEGIENPPVFICQDMQALDLYGTVQAAICCLDSLNYLPSEAALGRTLARVSLFLEPGGFFLFDVKSPHLFAQMGGTISLYEDDTLYGVWQYGVPNKQGCVRHLIDLFCQEGEGYSRLWEEHRQQVFSRAQIETALEAAGLRLKGVYQDLSTKQAKEETGRLFFVAQKK